ncbi:MAG TPA: protease pro-enzyme activation domain-containing protein [Streptosporangiaceae bacterium]|nr:protease pro-enzyme activation domain-containing protein [Streptosporangiaceae bacterium]
MTALMAPMAALAGPASASTPGPDTPEPVSSGINVASLPGTTAFGSTPADTPEDVSFILRERHVNALEAEAEQGFRHYLSVSQFAGSYGQRPASISALTSYLAHFGIKTDVYADDVDVSATGTAGEFDAALSVTQQQYHVPAVAARDGLNAIPAQNVHGIDTSPRLPYRLANFVLAIFGLTNYGPYASNAVHVNTKDLKPQQGSSNYCLALVGLPDACNLPSNFAANYDLDGLYAKGADGAGQTAAIVTLAAVDPGAPQYFWKNIAKVPNTGRTLAVDNIDGGPGAPSDASGSGETDLDLEQSGSLAYGANVLDYQAPNTDPGFADAFFTAASQNIASTVSTSWGEPETYLESVILSGQEASTYVAAFDEAFLEFAAQGQSGFDAAGDSGAYDNSPDTTNLSVDTPADSPYLTASGGTTLPFSGTLTGPDGSATVTVPTQRAWGWDYLWPATAKINDESEAAAAEANVGGGGGGFSAVEPTPSYQQFVPGTQNFHAVQYLTPTDYTTVAPGLVEPTAWNFNPAPSVTSGSGYGRAVPDMSADADPLSGYLLYEPSFAGIGEPVLQGDWGGTSFTSPQFNGSTAVIDSYLGHRVGFLNPSIYRAAQSSGDSPFTSLDTAGTSNDNLYYTGNPGEPYNQGAGLGIPDLTKLAGDLG